MVGLCVGLICWTIVFEILYLEMRESTVGRHLELDGDEQKEGGALKKSISDESI